MRILKQKKARYFDDYSSLFLEEKDIDVFSRLVSAYK